MLEYIKYKKRESSSLPPSCQVSKIIWDIMTITVLFTDLLLALFKVICATKESCPLFPSLLKDNPYCSFLFISISSLRQGLLSSKIESVPGATLRGNTTLVLTQAYYEQHPGENDRHSSREIWNTFEQAGPIETCTTACSSFLFSSKPAIPSSTTFQSSHILIHFSILLLQKPINTAW